MTDRPLLDVRDLATWLPTGNGVVRAVDGVSLRVERGRTLGVVGESGSGKTMLALSIMGILPSDAITPSGSVLFDGVDLRREGRGAMRRRWGSELAMVFQDPMTSLNPVVTIGRHLTETLRTHRRLSRAEARARAVELLTDVGIPDPVRRLRAYPHQLSGGMRQRVSIAIALSCGPALVIADEPTTALDVTIQRQILDLLSRLRAEREMSLILVTHDLGVVAGRTDDVAVMYGGRIVERGPTRQVFTRPRHPYTDALLRAIPRVEAPSHTRLAAIPGSPRPVVDPVGCRFAARCDRARERCRVEDPPLVADGHPEHHHACFFPVDRSLDKAATPVVSSNPTERSVG